MKKVLSTIIVALFATVLFGQTKIEIKPGELPACMNEWLKTNMKGYYFDKAYKVENKGEVSFLGRASLSKNEPKPATKSSEPNPIAQKPPHQWLAADKDCKAVKKVSDPAPEPSPKPKPTPKPSPNPAPTPK
jgi:hypothetical protein